MFNSELTRHLAELSKIGFTDSELDKMTEDMTNIISVMDKVKEYDEGMAPYALEAVTYEDIRADEYAASYPADKITANAKNVKNDSFVVPKVV